MKILNLDKGSKVWIKVDNTCVVEGVVERAKERYAIIRVNSGEVINSPYNGIFLSREEALVESNQRGVCL